MTDAAAPPRPSLAPDLRRFARAVVPTATAAGLQLATFVLTGRGNEPEGFGAEGATGQHEGRELEAGRCRRRDDRARETPQVRGEGSAGRCRGVGHGASAPQSSRVKR